MSVAILELKLFQHDAGALLTAEQLDALKVELSRDPRRGDLIPGTGGCHKIQVAAKGQGKRGGARVIYYYYNENYPLALIAIYGKGEKADLNGAWVWYGKRKLLK